MVPEIRKKFNAEFTPEKYRALLHDLNTTYDFPIGYRIAETPIFIGKDFKNEIL
ncbi:MAG: hypothetical protein IT281_07860, partial [Ignavibacteria bacterium]|nr:hypothetical protein [Ignavibacteria bacterium]